MVVLSWAIWPVPVPDARHSPEENGKLNLSFKGFQSELSHMRLSPSGDPGKKVIGDKEKGDEQQLLK